MKKFFQAFLFYSGALSLLVASSVVARDKDPEVFRAMKDELERSLQKLSLPDADKPYFIEYTISDFEKTYAGASFGALVTSNSDTKRYFKVGLRVGDASLDQTNFDTQESSATFESTFTGVTAESNYDVLRHDIWLTTDQAYKVAVEVLGRKKALLKSKSNKDKLPSFSSAPQLQQDLALSKPPALTEDQIVAMAKRLSAVFKSYNVISNSSVVVSLMVESRYYLNTEGSQIYEPRALLEIVVIAEGQAEDGTKLRDQVTFYANSSETMAKIEDLEKEVKNFAEDFQKMRNAKPLEDDFSGPIIFEGEAAGQLFEQLFAKALSGTPSPLADGFQRAEADDSLEPRLDKKVLPSFLSVEDDPTLAALQGKALIGGYKIDSEGVAAQKLLLVDAGTLKTLVSSRIPSKKLAASNGHGRGSLSLKARGQTSNLIIKVQKPDKNLRATAQKEAKTQKAPYVLVVRRLAADEGPSLEDLFSGGMQEEKGIKPFLAYKVYPDGKEEPVRGVLIEEIDLKELESIKAAGSDANVHNYTNSISGFNPFSVSFSRDLESFIPCSIVAPSILFSEGTVKASSGNPPKPTVQKHPYFDK